MVPLATAEHCQSTTATNEERRTHRAVLLDIPNNIDKKSLEKSFARYGESVRGVSQYLDPKKWEICWTVVFSDESSILVAMNEPIYVNGTRVRLEKLE